MPKGGDMLDLDTAPPLAIFSLPAKYVGQVTFKLHSSISESKLQFSSFVSDVQVGLHACVMLRLHSFTFAFTFKHGVLGFVWLLFDCSGAAYKGSKQVAFHIDQQKCLPILAVRVASIHRHNSGFLPTVSRS
ncbi:unnamed protein product [Hydatigera taeniaeformis]|uniref:Uncharacterized protein n=1 Tax=Hydatigena taeniaeformis TaxID=6205 RepID=A0A0R3XCJ5_HYDTA|nr:unnamed protein product [Hydatigera taeniaeformis]